MMDLCYAKKWTFTIFFQIAINGFHNPFSNNLPMLFKWWPHYIDVTMALKQAYEDVSDGIAKTNL
jgi:hypothetical protein